MTAPRIVRCPTCGGPSIFAPENTFRPFCSHRCRNADLGAWASGDYRIGATKAPDDADDDREPSTPHSQ